MIFENPYTQPHYLTNNFVKNADLIDKNRSLRGDFRRKPTQYWFFNCEPTYGESFQPTPDKLIKMHDDFSHQKDKSITERSMISPDYARNFICDFILGKTQQLSQMRLF